MYTNFNKHQINKISIQKTDDTHEFACTQNSHTMMGRNIVKETNLSDYLKDPKSLEIVTRILFSNRRKMINKNFNKLFNKNNLISKKLNLNLNLRPEELSNEVYYKIAVQYERLTA